MTFLPPRLRSLLLAVLCLLPGLSRATSLVRLDEATLATRADLIVRGVVLASQSAYRSGAIPVFTDVTLEVFEVLKGSHTEPLLHVALPGGDLDGRSFRIAGTPSFSQGEEVVLFLLDLPSGERTLLGFTQGKFRLEVDPATGLTQAVQDPTDVELVTPVAPNQSSVQALKAANLSFEWGSFRRRILGHLQGQGVAP